MRKSILFLLLITSLLSSCGKGNSSISSNDTTIMNNSIETHLMEYEGWNWNTYNHELIERFDKVRLNSVDSTFAIFLSKTGYNVINIKKYVSIFDDKLFSEVSIKINAAAVSRHFYNMETNEKIIYNDFLSSLKIIASEENISAKEMFQKSLGEVINDNTSSIPYSYARYFYIKKINIIEDYFPSYEFSDNFDNRGLEHTLENNTTHVTNMNSIETPYNLNYDIALYIYQDGSIVDGSWMRQDLRLTQCKIYLSKQTAKKILNKN